MSEVKQTKVKNGQLYVAVGKKRVFFRIAEWRECWMCGNKFGYSLNTALLEKSKGRFCSKKCTYRWLRKEAAARRPQQRCPICRAFFKSGGRSGIRKTCGDPECVTALKIKSRSMKKTLSRLK